MSNQPLTAAEISDLVSDLHRLSRNLWWTWNQQPQELFQHLSPRAWQNLYHNAAAVLHEVSDYELRSRLQDPELAGRCRSVISEFNEYLDRKDTWAAKNAPELVEQPVAYFSAEFGFHETLPVAAGGLGVLAADHAKSASDLGIGFYGVSLFYREGYFQQSINHENWQTEYYSTLNPKNLPIELVLQSDGSPLSCSVKVADSPVKVTAWKTGVGRATVLFLDTNHPENDQTYRDLTLRVYGGDTSTRIMQETILGIGGVRMLRAMGVRPGVFHMNEGHAAFLTLELAREKIAEGVDFSAAWEATRQECVFTTHTPVEAGHDRFSPDLISYAAAKFTENLKLSFEEVMTLGRVNPEDENEPFCMTVLALKGSRAANAVSELHGDISRQMWHGLYPDNDVGEVPIGHVTNGVHVAGWMKGTARAFWRKKLKVASGENSGNTSFFRVDWEQEVNEQSFWDRIADPDFISDEELWAFRFHLRRELVEFCRRRLMIQGQRQSMGDYIAYDSLMNPNALTIGFARRFATYKRAPLIFDRFEEIVSLAKDKERPVQFLFAGKAHPRDDAGKRFIQKILHLSKYSDLKGNLFFLENYDVHIARQMVSGCDVWLNNPRRPLEASGTSGMKAVVHGCLNLSILDGWWREGYNGENGFAIGHDSHPNDIDEQDRADSENLYHTLVNEVVPCFYNRDANGVPREWIAKIRNGFRTMAARFNTWRMVKEYAKHYYQR
ncbi:MAG: alpha-glucan family phosphorylase [Limisphaerales bacterium]